MEKIFEIEQKLLGENPFLLHEQSLLHLRDYSYSAVDKSLLSKHVLNPFWTYCAKFMPLWLAPNCITLIGVSAILVGHLIILALQYGDLFSGMPRIVYVFFGLSILFYQTMDNIDGKQARKTGTSSPLGELFDHGVDSLNCIWSSLLVAAALGQGSSMAAVCGIFAPMVGMYFSAWETYYTKTLFLNFLNAPTEGLVLMAFFCFLTAFVGPDFWIEKTIVTIPLGHVIAYGTVVALMLLHVPACMMNVKNKVADYRSALKNLWPIATVVLSLLIWASNKESEIRNGHLFLFSWTMSFTFGRISTTVILSHLCEQSFPKTNLLNLFLYLGSFLYGLLPKFGITVGHELGFIWVYFFIAAIYFFGFAHIVIEALTKFLGIKAFTI